MYRIDLTGQVFGRLTVLSFAGMNKHNRSTWRCVCQCGEEKTVTTGGLRNGHTQSCGCLHRERLKQNKGALKHGLYGTTEYAIWDHMFQRCRNPKNPGYKDYGGRGVSVCERWLTPSNFIADILADIGKRPSPKHSLDRVRNNGNYEPGNVRWATKREQATNRRSTRFVVFRGRRLSIAAWAREMGIGEGSLRDRINAGWDIELAMTATPDKSRSRNNHFVTYGGRTLTISAWARELGVPRDLLSWRFRAGWSPERALATPSARPSTPAPPSP